jgi:hypothetical protein
MEYDCRNEIYGRRINFVEIASAKLGNPAEQGTQGKEVIIYKNHLGDGLYELSCSCSNGLYQLLIFENEKPCIKKIEFFK